MRLFVLLSLYYSVTSIWLKYISNQYGCGLIGPALNIEKKQVSSNIKRPDYVYAKDNTLVVREN